MDVIVNFARTPYPSLCYIYLYNGLIQIRDVLRNVLSSKKYTTKFDPTKAEQNNDLHSQKTSLFLNQIFFSRRTNYDFTISTRKKTNQVKNVFFKTTLNQTQYQKKKADASLIYRTYEWNANRSKLCIIDMRIIGGAQGKSIAVPNKTFSNSCRCSISSIIQSQLDNRRFHIRNINSIDFSYESRRYDRSKWERHSNRPLSVKTFRSFPTVKATRGAKNSRNLRIFILNRFSYRVPSLLAHSTQSLNSVNASCARS